MRGRGEEVLIEHGVEDREDVVLTGGDVKEGHQRREKGVVPVTIGLGLTDDIGFFSLVDGLLVCADQHKDIKHLEQSVEWKTIYLLDYTGIVIFTIL